MAEEFLTKKIIDEELQFTPKLNWSTMYKLPLGGEIGDVKPIVDGEIVTKPFTGATSGSTIGESNSRYEKYFSVGDVKDNYLVNSSLPNNQLAVATDDFEKKDSYGWGLVINTPKMIQVGAEQPTSVRIEGYLGEIFYNHMDYSSINFSPLVTFNPKHSLTNNKFVFDNIYVENDGYVSIAKEDWHDLVLTYYWDNGSSRTASASNGNLSLYLSDKQPIFYITPNGLDPSGDIEDNYIASVSFMYYYIGQDFPTIYYPSFNTIYYNIEGENIQHTITLPTVEQLKKDDKISIDLGLFQNGSTINLWVGTQNVGEAYWGTPVHWSRHCLLYAEELTSSTFKFKLDKNVDTYTILITLTSKEV